MFSTSVFAQARRLAAYAAEKCARLERIFTTRRVRVYLRLAEDDPPEHPARPPSICTLKTRQWAIPPPHTNNPACKGGIRAGPHGPPHVLSPKGGDG